MYDPAEDSLMLAKYVSKLAKGKVLDLGTGSGIQALAAAKSKKTKSVLAVDIDKEVIKACKENIKNKKITFRYSNLFSNIKGKFDTIIFNPPYLPKDKKIKDKALYGGKLGYELIVKFLKQAKKHLNEDGIILVVFSSLTNKKKIDEEIKKQGFRKKELEKKRIFFEDLYVYFISCITFADFSQNHRNSGNNTFHRGELVDNGGFFAYSSNVVLIVFNR